MRKPMKSIKFMRATLLSWMNKQPVSRGKKYKHLSRGRSLKRKKKPI